MTPERALEIALAVLDADPSKLPEWDLEPEVDVSTRRGVTRAERARMRELIDAGWTSSRIARELSVSERCVGRYRAKLRLEEQAWEERARREATLASYQVGREVDPFELLATDERPGEVIPLATTNHLQKEAS